jgi:CubicO group peptidase (beta-lactamase class C family)
MADQDDLKAWLDENADAAEVPGVAVGVYHEGTEHYAAFGTTSIEHPLPVDADTLFLAGSTGKTITGTAIMRLVDEGRVDLNERVRAYVPEFRVADEDTSDRVTVLHLLNHTAGWAGELYEGTGQGDDAVARYVELMAQLPQEFPIGATASYNNASLSLAGRVIEKVTGTSFDKAIADLLLRPLGMDHSFYLANDVMTHKFAVGHMTNAEGELVLVRPYRESRGMDPAGGMSTTVRDLITWAKFHLGDGRSADGERVLKKETLDSMKQPTVDIRGGVLGDYIGISWFLRDIGGVRVVGHGGNTAGHNCSFSMVPERDFAVTVLTNSALHGSALKEKLVRWVLDSWLGIDGSGDDLAPIALDDATLARYAGTYETHAVTVSLSPKDGGLEANISIKPETAKQLYPNGAPKQPPIAVRFLPGDTHPFVYGTGDDLSSKGYFARDGDGNVIGIHLGGRLAMRTGDRVAAGV